MPHQYQGIRKNIILLVCMVRSKFLFAGEHITLVIPIAENRTFLTLEISAGITNMHVRILGAFTVI